jgi:hypothetical protein
MPLPDLPNSKNLPYWVIFCLCAAIGVLYGRIVEIERDCDTALQQEREYWERRFTAERENNEKIRNEMLQFVSEQRAKYDELLTKVRTQ